MGHSVGLVLVATREWFIRFLYTTKNLGVPGSSRGTLECNRADLTIYTIFFWKQYVSQSLFTAKFHQILQLKVIFIIKYIPNYSWKIYTIIMICDFSWWLHDEPLVHFLLQVLLLSCRFSGNHSSLDLEKPNSWTYNFVEVSGYNLESSQSWGFCIDLLKP